METRSGFSQRGPRKPEEGYTLFLEPALKIQGSRAFFRPPRDGNLGQELRWQCYDELGIDRDYPVRGLGPP